MKIKFNKTIAIVIVVIICLIIAAFVGINSVTAKAINYEEKVDESWSNINVQEKRRADLIPALVECIKSYDQHEYQTLMDVISARKNSDGTIPDGVVTEVQNAVNVVVEQYPELNSQQNYRELINEISITENLIAETRQAYNKAISRYNTFVRNPINSFFLGMTGYEKLEYQRLNYEVEAYDPTNLFS